MKMKNTSGKEAEIRKLTKASTTIKTTNELIRNVMKEKGKTEKIESVKMLSFKILKVLLLGVPLLLSGCIGMNSKFDCNVSPDGKCVPMGTIHKMADWGEFNERSNRRIIEYNNLVKTNKSGRNNESNIWIGSNTNTNNKYPRQRYFSDASSTDPLFPPRSNEAIQKIWIGPYEDENGNYHEASNVYAVIKKARWLAEAEQTAKE